jgi:hypothetical protein
VTAKTEREIGPALHDLEIVVSFLNDLDKMTHITSDAFDSNRGYVKTAEIVIAEDSGYIIATGWFDVASEAWRADFSRFGEEL